MSAPSFRAGEAGEAGPTRAGEAGAAAGDKVQPLGIQVAAGTAAGPTTLAAFDGALRVAGVANFNLIRLSSIAPPGSVVDALPGGATPEGTWGDRLYVVLAEERVETHNEEAWAGIGWTQERATGRGLFVEHHGNSRHRVDADITSSLVDLTAGRPGMAFTPVQRLVTGATCVDEPVCALVVAVFGSEPWPAATTIDLR